MTQTRTGSVFISYSRIDGDVMLRMTKFLRGKGIKVWVDNERLVPGTPIWEAEVEKAIVNAAAIVVLLSPDSKNSPWVRREISYAEDNNKQIFPILIAGDERISIPIRLTSHQRIDFRKNEERGLNALAVALAFYLEEVEREKAEAERRARAEAERSQAELNADEEPTAKKAQSSTVPQARAGGKEATIIRPEVQADKLADRSEFGEITPTPNWFAVIGITLGWILGWVLANVSSHAIRQIIAAETGRATVIAMNWKIAAAIDGATAAGIGGLITAIILRFEGVLSKWRSLLSIVLGWVLGGALGATIGWTITMSIGLATGWTNATTIGLAIGWASAAAIGGLVTAIILRRENILSNWKSILWSTLGWMLGGILSRTIAWIFAAETGELFVVTATAASAATIGGLVLGITLRRERILSNWKSIFWITLGWTLSWAIAAAVAVESDSLVAISLAIVCAAAIGGLVTAITLRREHILSNWRSILWITLGWTLGWVIGALSSAATGLAILTNGISASATVTLAIIVAAIIIIVATAAAIGGLVTILILRREHAHPGWKSIIWIMLGWVLATAIAWVIFWAITSKTSWAISLTIGWAIGWAVAGFVTIWQIGRAARLNAEFQVSTKSQPSLFAQKRSAIFYRSISIAIFIIILLQASAERRANEVATARATATAIARSTRSAITIATHTASAFATAQSVNKYVEIFGVYAELVYGPEKGSLVHLVDESIEGISANVELRDSIVVATFMNPYSVTTGSWDCGFLFRNEYGDDQYRLVILSNERWVLQNYTGSADGLVIQEGELSNLNLSKNGSNTILLYYQGEQGQLYVNEEFVANLDLSARLNPGDVTIATGLYSGDEIDGYATDFKEFIVWNIP